jgi:hypothetical protein
VPAIRKPQAIITRKQRQQKSSENSGETPWGYLPYVYDIQQFFISLTQVKLFLPSLLSWALIKGAASLHVQTETEAPPFQGFFQSE